MDAQFDKSVEQGDWRHDTNHNKSVEKSQSVAQAQALPTAKGLSRVGQAGLGRSSREQIRHTDSIHGRGRFEPRRGGGGETFEVEARWEEVGDVETQSPNDNQL